MKKKSFIVFHNLKESIINDNEIKTNADIGKATTFKERSKDFIR